VAALTPALPQLRRLHPPADAADVYSAAMAAYAKKLELLRTASRRIAGGDDPVTTIHTLEQRLGPIVSQENGAWDALGIPACVSR
jgi:hypothetical protein